MRLGEAVNAAPLMPRVLGSEGGGWLHHHGALSVNRLQRARVQAVRVAACMTSCSSTAARRERDMAGAVTTQPANTMSTEQLATAMGGGGQGGEVQSGQHGLPEGTEGGGIRAVAS